MVRKLMLSLLVFLFSAPALAQRLPPPALMVQDNDRSQPLELSEVDVDVRIVGQVAETRMTMTFYNPQSRNMAGDLFFPLPEGATVSGYALDIAGKMVDGVVVPKDKARQVFEIEVRKGIDPGLVEWVKGSNFKTRVFPIPPKGTRTIMVRYVTQLVRDKAGPNYQLPLNFREAVGKFHLRIEVVKPVAPPTVTGGELANFQFAAWRDGFVAETTLEKQRLVNDLSIAIPDTRPAAVRVEKASDKNHYFYARLARPSLLLAGGDDTVKRIAIYWDATGSMGEVDRTKELQVLQELLKRLGDVTVDLVLFRNEMGRPATFEVKGGDASKLVAALKAVDALCERLVMTATPMLAPTSKTWSCQLNWNSRIVSCNLSAIRRPWSRRQPTSSTPNSSPPKRASVSSSRTRPRSRSASWRTSSSPATCPQVSLTTLNWSRSR